MSEWIIKDDKGNMLYSRRDDKVATNPKAIENVVKENFRLKAENERLRGTLEEVKNREEVCYCENLIYGVECIYCLIGKALAEGE